MSSIQPMPASFMAALEAAVSGNGFEAHFQLQSLNLSQRSYWELSIDQLSVLDRTIRHLCNLSSPPINLLLEILSSAPGGLSRLHRDVEQTLTQTLMQQDLDVEGARLLVQCANELVEDYTRMKVPTGLSLLTIICFSMSTGSSSGISFDVQRFASFLASSKKTDFLPMISSILMPVVTLAENGQLDEAGIDRIEHKLTGPLYELCSALAATPGMINRQSFFETQDWFITDRMEDIPQICRRMALFDHRQVALLMARIWTRSVKSFQDHLKGSQGLLEKRLHKCQRVLEYVREHLDPAHVQDGLTHLFAGLLAQYGHLLHYGGHSSYQLLVEVLNSIFSYVDVEHCQELLKRRNGIYLSLYLRDFSPKTLNVLSESNLTELLEHDLGL